MKYKVFVDGQEGTTGLKIREYLAKRDDLSILEIDASKRKDKEARKLLLNEADIAFLCLPDEVARESATLVTNPRTKIIDASTAFRTNDDWVYGLPELHNRREKIATSKRVSNPGCHATAFILSMYPLVQNGIVPQDYPIFAQSITGYSGGGKKLIQAYESEQKEAWNSPKPYALSLHHKHLPEMKKMVGLSYDPIFTPIVANYYKGLAVSIALHPRMFQKKMGAKDIHELLSSYYEGEKFVSVMPYDSDANLDNGFFSITGCNDTNRSEIFVFGEEDRVLLLCRLDNLGKGASGAAIQNMNIMLGLEEGLGLTY